jgi:leader peptidase (prepilin peptidase)/N-methyltransferase
MGFGDVKLMAMVGAFLGWKLALVTYFIAPFYGVVVGLVLKFRMKQDIMAYGPYLSLGAFTALLFGNAILKLMGG